MPAQRRESTKYPRRPSTRRMIDYSDLIQPDKGQDARTIHLVDQKSYDGWLKERSPRERAHLAAVGFKPDAYVHAILPGDPEQWAVVTSVARVDSCPPGAAIGANPARRPLPLHDRQPGKALFGWISAPSFRPSFQTDRQGAARC